MVEPGHYAKKQINCRNRLISWSHRQRFKIALQLLKELNVTNLLDYGCGDGTFLGMLVDSNLRVQNVIGAEIDDYQIQDCRRRIGERPNVQFLRIDDLSAAGHAGAYDAVFCMEVLEHVVHLDDILNRLISLLAPGGRLFVSVPVETGLPVVLKQIVRRVAGWRNLGDYKFTSRYSPMELLRSVFAGEKQHITRPIYKPEVGPEFHDHKGFNWRVVKCKLLERLTLERQVVSPLPFLGPFFASQVWWIMRKNESCQHHA